ncbi:MAG: hypothetical protein JWL65_987, partial [Gammaproteobacteria bacterium]|nr:hypothetical protein [Gammaproteobacteria bacterium]
MNGSYWPETCPPKGSAGRVDLADHPSFFEFRFPLAPITRRDRNGNSLKKLAQTTIRKRARARALPGLLQVFSSFRINPVMQRRCFDRDPRRIRNLIRKRTQNGFEALA